MIASKLVVVEDSATDFNILIMTLESLGFTRPIRRLKCYDEAMDWLHRRDAQPLMMLLDLNLQGQDGRDILRAVRSDESLRGLPVVVLTTSTDPRDADECYRAGASSYMVKQISLADFEDQMKTFVHYWFTSCQLPRTYSR